MSTIPVSNNFEKIIPVDSSLEKLFSGTVWAEGPVWKEDKLIWSDVRSNKMYSYNQKSNLSEVFRDPSGFNNGNCLDNEGRLVRCQHGFRRIIREEENGDITIIADKYQEKKFNSPNDVAVKKDGTIWFTDPPYGILTNEEGTKATSEQEGNFVFKVLQDGTVEKILDNFDKPNGIVFSPNENFLYVGDSGAASPGNIDLSKPHHVKRYTLSDEGKPMNEQIFCEIEGGFPDGMVSDNQGNLFICDPHGQKIHIYDDASSYLGVINMPERVANCTFGGEDKSQLFITASSSLYLLKTNTIGAK
jgi:gluconolactonase